MPASGAGASVFYPLRGSRSADLQGAGASVFYPLRGNRSCELQGVGTFVILRLYRGVFL